MKITIDVPDMKCAKCATTAPIQPNLLYLKGQAPPQFREVFSVLLKEHSDMMATDNAGCAWEALVDSKPIGWVKGPNESDLCAACGALWLEAGKAFLEAPPVVEPAPVKAPEKPAAKVQGRPPMRNTVAQLPRR